MNQFGLQLSNNINIFMFNIYLLNYSNDMDKFFTLEYSSVVGL